MISDKIYKFAKELWPINISITVDGIIETQKKILKHPPTLQVKSIPSGTQVFDWTVPKE